MSYICNAKTITMLKSLLLGVFLMCYHITINSQTSTKDICKISQKSYSVQIKSNVDLGISNKHVIPRNLKEEEYCLVLEHRDTKKTTIISLDELHELVIYPVKTEE